MNVLRILFLAWISAGVLFGQTKEQCLSLADSLYADGVYNAALELYDRVIFFSESSQKPELYCKKARIHTLNNEPNKAIENLLYAFYLPECNDSLRLQIRLRVAFNYLILGDYIACMVILEEPRVDWTNLYRDQQLLLGIAYYLATDYKQAKMHLAQAGVAGLENQLLKPLRRRIFVNNAIIGVTALVPGSGFLWYGQRQPAIAGSALNSAFATGFWYVATMYNPIDALILVGVWWSRYYIGQIGQVSVLAANANKNDRKILLTKLLVK